MPASALSFPFLEQGADPSSLIIMVVGLVAIWLFIVILPERRNRRARQAMLSTLKPGDRVLTQAGIVGEVRKVKEDEVLVETGDTQIAFVRSAIINIVNRKDAAAPEKARS